ARPDPPDPRLLSAGLARGRRGRDDLAAARGDRGLRRARRHRLPCDRPDPVRHRAAGHRGAGPARDDGPRASGPRRPRARHGRRRRLGHPRARRRRDRVRRGQPHGHRCEERARAGGVRHEGRAALRPRAPGRAVVPRRHRADRRAGLHPGARHRARAPLSRGMVAAGPHPGLGERLHEPGPRPAAGRPEPRPRRLLPRLRGRARPPADPRGRHRLPPRRRRDRPPLTPRTPPSPTRRSHAAMPHPHALFTGQWADLTLEQVAELAAGWGYDGLEIAVSGEHLDASRWDDEAYIAERLGILEKHGLKVWTISNHLKGQAICDDPIDFRHQAIVGPAVWGDGDPEGVRQRAAVDVKNPARLAQKLGVDSVVGFTGSKIWKYVAMLPPVGQDVIDEGYQDFADRWNPILVVFEECGVRFAHEVHPSEIAYDYWTTKRTLEAIGHRESFGLNW